MRKHGCSSMFPSPNLHLSNYKTEQLQACTGLKYWTAEFSLGKGEKKMKWRSLIPSHSHITIPVVSFLNVECCPDICLWLRSIDTNKCHHIVHGLQFNSAKDVLLNAWPEMSSFWCHNKVLSSVWRNFTILHELTYRAFAAFDSPIL